MNANRNPRMNRGIPYSLLTYFTQAENRSQKNKGDNEESDFLLNLCPSALIVVDTINFTIIGVNQVACDLSGYTKTDLLKSNFFDIVHESTIESDPRNGLSGYSVHKGRPENQPVPGLELHRKEGSVINNLSVKSWARSKDGKRITFVFNYGDGFISSSMYSLSSDKISASAVYTGLANLLTELSNFANFAHPSPNEKSASHSHLPELSFFPIEVDGFKNILSAMQRLSSYSCMAIYLLDPQSLEYQQKGVAGNGDWLPRSVSAQESIQINRSQVWKSGKRPQTIIQRAAYTNNFSYLVTFPFHLRFETHGNQENFNFRKNTTRPALLIVADHGRSYTEDDLYLVEVFSEVIRLSLDIATKESKFDLLQQNLKLGVSYQTLLGETIEEGIILLTPDFRIQNSNSVIEGILGYGRTQIIGQPIERILIGTETIQAVFDEMRSTQGYLARTEVRLYRRSGEAFLARFLARPLLLDEQLQSIVILMQDLTPQVKAKELTEQLEQRALLGEITAVFAHEVRNPINNISTGLELLSLSLPVDDPNQSTITRLVQDCDRLAELMKSVLAFARPTEYTLSVLSLEPYLNSLLERSRPRMERANVCGSLQVEAGTPAIMASPRALEQVIVNLINNAIQAIGESGGEIILKASRPRQIDLPNLFDANRFVEIDVVDTGPGIPKEVQERIFQPFYTTNHNGTGLGLAIAKRIITAHHGHITVNSMPGGTIFRLFLPEAATKFEE